MRRAAQAAVRCGGRCGALREHLGGLSTARPQLASSPACLQQWPSAPPVGGGDGPQRPHVPWLPRGHAAAGARGSCLLPAACSALLQVRWSSARAGPTAEVTLDAVAEAASTGAGAAAGAASTAASEVASIASDSNAGVAALQHMVEWFHVAMDLPWCGALRPERTRAACSSALLPCRRWCV